MFIKKKLNKKGLTFVDLLISLSILLFIFFAIGQIQFFLSKSNNQTDKAALILETVTNTIADTYQEKSWKNLGNKSIKTKHGDLTITYGEYKEKTPFFTEKISIDFKLDNINKKIQLERSVFSE